MATITNSLTNAEYHAVNAYSKSTLDLIHTSPALLQWARDAPQEKSEAIENGTAIHCALLETDEFAQRYVKIPQYNMRTTEGKANAEHFKESMSGSGRIIMTADDYDLIIAMRDSVMAHPVARRLLTVSGKSEQSIFWERDGLRLKCRPDRIPDSEHFGHMLIDVKKTGDVDHLAKSIHEFRYNVQAAFYSDAYEQLTGEYPRFIFIAVGERRSIGRHPVSVFELPLDWVEDGRSAYLADLEIAKEMEEFGSSLDVEVFKRPEWTRR